MDFSLPPDLAAYLDELDDFIERVIKPLEQQDDNIRFFDHRREDARTDWDRGGLPNEEWEQLLARGPPAGRRGRPLPLRRSPRSTAARTARTSAWPSSASTSPTKGLGLHNDLQNEHSIVGNNVGLLLMLNYGTDEQKAEWVDDLAARPARLRLRHHRAAARLRRHVDGDPRRARRRRVDHQRREDVEHRHPQGEVRPDLRPHVAASRATATASRRSSRPTDAPGLQDRRVPVDVQHADRPRPRRASPTSGCRTRRSSAARARGLQVVAALLQREPHPPGRLVARRRPVLHQRVGEVRQGAQAVRQAAVVEPGASSSRSSSCRRSARCCGR